MPMWIQVPQVPEDKHADMKEKRTKAKSETAKRSTQKQRNTKGHPPEVADADPMQVDVVLKADEYRSLLDKARRGTELGFTRLGR